MFYDLVASIYMFYERRKLVDDSDEKKVACKCFMINQVTYMFYDRRGNVYMFYDKGGSVYVLL